MKGVERMNMVIVRSQQQEAGFRNLYAIDVDRSQNRNCYVCGGFRHMVKNCRNREIGINRRMDQIEDNSSNLNGERGLIGSN